MSILLLGKNAQVVGEGKDNFQFGSELGNGAAVSMVVYLIFAGGFLLKPISIMKPVARSSMDFKDS
jgi:hypothetical protein